MERPFADRREAGRVLARALARYRSDPTVLVLGLPRGGVPVAYEVAAALGKPLDVFLVRKLGAPGHEELAMGAIATGNVIVMNDDVIRMLDPAPDVIRAVAARERDELERRERAYRGDKPPPDVRGRTIVLVDDGLATGSSMRAAIQALRSLDPGRVIVAVPTAPAETCRELEAVVDEVVCLSTPQPFFAVGQAYSDFSQTSDDEVRALLSRAERARVAPSDGNSDPPPRVPSS